MRQLYKNRRDLLDLMIDRVMAFIGRGVCSSCKGKWLDDICPSCQFINGIALKEVYENGWTKKQTLKIAKERKKN